MKKVKIFKGIIPVLFASTVLVSLSGCNKKENQSRQENLIGHFDVKDPDDISSSDFICYNVGNHEHIGVTEQDKKLKKCEKNDISTAIIIDCEATTRLEIFEDIEFTKSTLENYSIDLPVYLNINHIMENDELTMETKVSLINEYVVLTEKNNIYVGLYGTSTNLSVLNQYGILISKDCDCFVVEDDKTEYNGLTSIRQDKNGNIKSTYQSTEYNNDLAQMIKANNKNNPEEFKQNGYYIIGSNFNIETIAIKYGLSVNDILSYNNVKKEDLIEGMILRIPNEIQEKTELVYPTLIREKTALYRGIDMSHYQGEADKINFEKLSKNIDFAILKIGEQVNKDFDELKEDPCFTEYYRACNSNNISLGGYYVTHATTVNEAIAEAKLIVNRIKGLNIKYPIYIDYENIPGSNYGEEFKEIKQNGGFEQMLEEANKIFEEAGFRFGIYTNLSTYDEMVNMIGLQTLNQYEIWLARPNGYTDINQVLDYGPICKTDNGQYSYGCDMMQVSWTISNIGIKTDVDYNLCYKDYEKPKYLIEYPPEQTFETQTYNRKDYKKMMKTGIETSSILVAAFILNKKRKRIKRRIMRVFKKQKIQPIEHNTSSPELKKVL